MGNPQKKNQQAKAKFFRGDFLKLGVWWENCPGLKARAARASVIPMQQTLTPQGDSFGKWQKLENWWHTLGEGPSGNNVGGKSTVQSSNTFGEGFDQGGGSGP